MENLWNSLVENFIKNVSDEKSKDELKIDENNLREEANEQPERYAYWASQVAVAEKALAQVELKLTVLEASLHTKYQETLISEKGKATETSIKSLIETDESWIKAKKQVIQWKYYVGKAKALEGGWKQRAQMIWVRGTLQKGDMDMRKSFDSI